MGIQSKSSIRRPNRVGTASGATMRTAVMEADMEAATATALHEAITCVHKAIKDVMVIANQALVVCCTDRRRNVDTRCLTE